MYQPFPQTVLQNINRTMLYPCRKSTQNNVKSPLHGSLIPAELHRAAKKLPSCLRKTKRTREEPPNDLHTDNQGRNTTILKDTRIPSQPCEQQGDTHNRKIERTKESLQHHHVQSNKNDINNNNKPKKKCNKEASAEEAEEDTPKAPGI
jgi:hypothetical protein